MEYVVGGPDLPEKLISEHKNGNLVFFCGAGISMHLFGPFDGLLRTLFNDLSQISDPFVRDYLAAQQDKKLNLSYDQVIQHLEEKLTNNEIEKSLIKIFSKRPSNLSQHRSILKLAHHGSDGFKLVTTNFDPFFEKVLRKEKYKTNKFYVAPELPIPKPGRWNGLVYLHGRIRESTQPTDIEIKNIVFSSRSFGQAYITEGWASRFIRTLFDHYSVVFIGYSLSDPVVRYLTSAYNADRKLRKHERHAWMFISADNDHKKQLLKESGVIPITYKTKNEGKDHSLLYECLEKWAERYSLGIEAHIQDAIKAAHSIPKLLPNNELDIILPSLKTEEGAREFSLAYKLADLSWLTAFDDNQLLNFDSAPSNSLVFEHRNSEEPLPTYLNYICLWLARHIRNHELLNWVLDKGAGVHSQFRRYLLDALSRIGNDSKDYEEKDQPIDQDLKKAWLLLLDNSVQEMKSISLYDFYLLESNFRNSDLKDVLHCNKVIEQFTPIVILRKSLPSEWGNKKGIHKYLTIEVACKMRGRAFLLKEAIDKHAQKLHFYKTYFHRLKEHLVKAIYLFEYSSRVDQYFDPSLMDKSDLTIDDRTYDDEWVVLVELVRDAIKEIAIKDKKTALVYLHSLQDINYPVFRRIVLFSYTLFKDKSTLIEGARFLAKNYKFFDTRQHEVYLFISHVLKSKYAKEIISTFTDAIVRGNRQEDRKAYDILSLIKSSGTRILNKAATKKLNDILKRKPRWKPILEEKAWNSFRTEVRWGHEISRTSSQISKLEKQDLLKFITNTESPTRDGDLEQLRYYFVEDINTKEGAWAKNFIDLVISNKIVIGDFWYEIIYGLAETAFDKNKNIALIIANYVLTLPDRILKEIEWSIGYWIKKWSDSVTDDSEQIFWQLWDRMAQLFYQKYDINNVDLGDRHAINAAINDISGRLAEALITRLVKPKPKKESKIPSEFLGRINLIAEAETIRGRLGRVILFRYLNWLLHIDSKWVKKNLLPRLDWKKPEEAQPTWEGFMNGNAIPVELFPQIRDYWMEGLNVCDPESFSSKNLWYLLIEISILFPKKISYQEIHDIIEGCQHQKSLSNAAFAALRVITRDIQAAEKIWEENLKPWFEKAWPRTKNVINSDTSEILARIILSVGSKLPSAWDLLKNRIGKVSRTNLIYHLSLQPIDYLGDSLISLYPQEVLFLIDKITSDEISNAPYGLDDVIRALQNQQKDTDIFKTKEYRRLAALCKVT